MNLTNPKPQAQPKVLKPESFQIKLPNVLVMGESGAGKTRSICGLNPAETKILLTEKSTLTFPNARRFYEAGSVFCDTTFVGIMQTIIELSKDTNTKFIVIDSFTGMWRSALKMAQKDYNGFAVWDNFAKYVQDFLNLIMDIPQCVMVISHSEKVSTNDMDNDYTTEVVIEGKKIKKLPLSSSFEATLYATKEFESDDSVKYYFYTNALRHTPAKSPEGMLERIIPNDLGLVAKAILEYYK